MTYSEFIYKAKDLTIAQADNGMWYLEPEWQDLISRNITCELDDLYDSYLSGWYDVEDILKLEVEKRNTINSKLNAVTDWMFDLITSTMDPAMLKEETEYMQHVVEFMKEKKNIPAV